MVLAKLSWRVVSMGKIKQVMPINPVLCTLGIRSTTVHSIVYVAVFRGFLMLYHDILSLH